MLELSKKELEDMYNNNTNDYVCEKLDITKVTLVKYLKEAGIPLKGKGNSSKIRLVD